MATASKIVKLKSKSIATPIQQTMLVRDFIHDRLYEEPGGYFTRQAHQVGRLREPIKFTKLRGYFDYRQEMERVYPENAWVTPSELFKPYYGYTIANFMLNQLETLRQRKLRVVEMGPGTGTFADSMLDFFKNYDLDLYRECEYIFIEISPQLAAQCEDLMRQNHKGLLESNKIKIFNGSIFDFTKKIGGNMHCFVVGLEVLDNMPHDRLHFDSNGKLTQQTMVTISDDGSTLSEHKALIADKLCHQFVDLYESMPTMDHISANKVLQREGFFKRLQEIVTAYTDKSGTNNIFAPTAAVRLLKHITDHIPDHTLIMADFDSFLMPKNSIKGINAPLVTNKLKDPTKWTTYDTQKRGAADICFPVDFHFLRHAYQQLTNQQASVYKTSEFIDKYALQSWCSTQNMFNPMRDEYFNTSFLVTERSATTGAGAKVV